VIPTYKDSRKKVAKALEELEAAESKYLSIKKPSVINQNTSHLLTSSHRLSKTPSQVKMLSKTI